MTIIEEKEKCTKFNNLKQSHKKTAPFKLKLK